MHIHRKIRNQQLPHAVGANEFSLRSDENQMSTPFLEVENVNFNFEICHRNACKLWSKIRANVSYENGIRCRWKWHTEQMRCERNHLIANSSHVPRNRARNGCKYNITFLTCTTCPTSEVPAPRPPFCIFILSFFTHSTYFRCSWDRRSDINDRHFVNCNGFSPIWWPMERGPQ